jgi:hypothetical protein
MVFVLRIAGTQLDRVLQVNRGRSLIMEVDAGIRLVAKVG